jgi:acetyltransferase-like isoleucine patch superfamily enzyme
VHIGAILTVPSEVRLQHLAANSNGNGEPSNGFALPGTTQLAHWDVLGKSVLDRVCERLQVFGVSEITVIPEQDLANGTGSGPSASTFWTAWNDVMSRYLEFDLTTLLLVRVGPYIELDIADFLQFHRETSSVMTQVYDAHGALDLVAVDGKSLAQGTGTFRARLQTLIPRQKRYPFSGYCNRLADVRDFHRLATDALRGRAAIRPLGREIRANVWVGDNARIDDSVRIVAPAYIGRNSRIHADCVINGACAIEQNSDIGRGTTVDDSCVLAGTYVGPGLRVCGGVVHQQTFFHLGRNVQLQFDDRRLFGKSVPARGFMAHRRPTGYTSGSQSVQ